MDDLKQINGVGPSVAKVMKAAGIETFAALAALTPTDLADKLEAAGGVRASAADFSAWIEEAKTKADQNETKEPAQAASGPAALTEIAATTAQLEARQAELDERSEKLDEREKAVAVQEESLRQEAERKTAEFEGREKALAQREARIAAQESGAAATDGTPAADAAAADEGDEPVETVLVEVTGPKKGRFRAGRRFDAEPARVRVTPSELAMIEGDPVLKVTEIVS